MVLSPFHHNLASQNNVVAMVGVMKEIEQWMYDETVN